MGLFDRLRGQAGSQFIEIIDWLEDGADTLVYRFPVEDQEIKMGARLTVRENQLALFVNEGRAADLFGPGLHTLSTRNVPILTTLKGWKHGFRSPFKAEVYFFSTRLFTDLKWGTTQPVLLRDPEFGMIRLRAFGTYAIRIEDARICFGTVVGSRGLTTTEAITGQLRSMILTRFSDTLAESGVAALDISSRLDELSSEARARAGDDFRALGLDLARFFIESVSLPEEVQGAVDQRTRLGVVGDRMAAWTQLRAADAMTMAAVNDGGAAGAGMGLGAGVAMGQLFGQAVTAPVAPPPAAPAPRWTLSMGGQNFGPYSEQALAEMIRSGQIPVTTLAWKPGASSWSELGSYPEFAHLVTPPPAPGRKP